LKIITIILFFTIQIFAQISPGELTNAHANLEGMSNCTKCHEIGKKVLSSKCLDCHSEIKQLVSAKRGYHSNPEVKKKECFSCHNEHHGRNFRIINFKEDGFDHKKTGFDLTGAHAKKECKDCHQAKFITYGKLKNKNNTHLGLNQNCVTCHEDYHHNTLGKDCASCHNTEKFTSVDKFDHNKAAFKLLGAHQKVECSKCHPKEVKNGKDVIKLKGIGFANCSSCHKDVHKGAFGADCKSCHSVNGFNIINRNAFDHSKTKYPLIGKHRTVKCNDCHKGINKTKPIFAKCTDCHNDFHKGDFTQNSVVKDCENCHSVQGFSPALFTIEEHNNSKFKLEGSHLAVACRQCHNKEKDWKFRNIGLRCQDCHQNVHGKEISEKFIPENKCESCHETENWHKITFDHNSTKFVLLGKHLTSSCSSCHYPIINGKKEFRFVSLNNNCEQCHKDIHLGQFKSDGISLCEKCHAFDNWKATKFDHSKASFSTEGAHKTLECSKCHKKVSESGNSYINYKIKDFKCASCHSK
jgi:hypothetical protein